MVSDVARGTILDLAGVGSAGHRGSFQQLLRETTPVPPPLAKPGHANPMQTEFTLDGVMEQQLLFCQ